MLNPSNSHTALAHLTFGRDHCDPPPLPASVQVAAEQGNSSDVFSNMSMQAFNLPQDFDHLVRSIGEW